MRTILAQEKQRVDNFNSTGLKEKLLDFIPLTPEALLSAPATQPLHGRTHMPSFSVDAQHPER
ncbi:unnamed protein product, partial [Amoebophrya sp. A25]|eukprot:GSA25T00018312001.1